MRVELAKAAGFCMGVRRAMDIALHTARTAPRPVFTYGPLIHNPSALSLLRVRGVGVLTEIPDRGHGTVIIRAHGVPPGDRQRLEAAGFDVVDATCSRVVKVQMIVRRYAREGYRCLLIGDKGHPEVIGIMGHAEGSGILVAGEEDIEALTDLDRYIIVAQTTQDRERFDRWCERILDRHPGGQVFNTICDSTHKRQAEVRRLASRVEAVVVVGGKQSANTRRLAEIAGECGSVAVAVETDEDLDMETLARFKKVGITAGASTPNWVINRVVREIGALPGTHEPLWVRWVYRGVRFLHESNLWTALAAAALACSVAVADSGGTHIVTASLMAFCYIFAMHTLNRLIDREAGEYNDPLRARFLARNRGIFYSFSLAAVLAGLGLSLHVSFPSFVFLLALTAFGVLYTTPLIPGPGRSRSLKDLPGSKALFVALAWASVTVLVPLTAWPPSPDTARWVLFVLVAILVYLRAALMEILDVQGDRIVGRETLAVFVGEGRAVFLVRFLALALAACSVAFPALGLITWHALAFLPVSLWVLGLSRLFSGERVGQNLRLEIMLEASFFLFLVGVLLIDAFMGMS
jgi:(E)-4-hydroxy-3-methyl-but-2-enyl pyrophosphate reductase